jgi:phosphate transport system substrate-binding protein
MKTRIFSIFSIALTLLVFAAACGGGDDEGGGGVIAADGSSTVGPFVTRAAEDFKAAEDVDVTVGISGTGGGFERFCAGETDLSNASRAIDEDEQTLCADAGVEYLEIRVATDALTNVVNAENDWATCLTVEQLNSIWKPGSEVNNWNQVDPSFPDVPLKLYGAGTDSGTFDYFTDVINGEEGRSRDDYTPSEDDNVLVEGVSGDQDGSGYFGFSYYAQNQDALNLVSVDDGKGCVAPSTETIQSGEYSPLSRPLFMYPGVDAIQKPEVKAYMQYVVDNYEAIAEQAQIVPMDSSQATEASAAFEKATG